MPRIRYISAAFGAALLFPLNLDAGTWRQTIQRPDCSFCEQGELQMEAQIEFGRVYTGNYRHGEPYDFVTVDPSGTGESFADAGISIRARFACLRPGQDPILLVGEPAASIVLYNPNLCMCIPMAADAGTDADGWVEWSGSPAAGGCAQGLSVFVDGVYFGDIPINLNSADFGSASPCFTDHSDLAVFVTHLGQVDLWDICFDFNESGPPTIDAADLAFFASTLGAACSRR